MNPRQAKIIELRYIGGLSFEDAAAVLDMFIGFVLATASALYGLWMIGYGEAGGFLTTCLNDSPDYGLLYPGRSRPWVGDGLATI